MPEMTRLSRIADTILEATPIGLFNHHWPLRRIGKSLLFAVCRNKPAMEMHTPRF
jgi:hypothetical protein